MVDIGPWLTALGLERYIEIFRKREIDLEIIPLLSELDLREMGIPLGPRKKILHASVFLPAAEYRSPVRTDVRSAERRHLTILFCDLVASTEYAERLDPEDFGHLVERFVQSCTTILQRHGGLVANYQGDAISGYFGYPVADEDDTERALIAGLEILCTVSGIAEPGGSPIQVRLGVASGHVVVGNLLGAPTGVSIVAFGHVPHLAARLQALAQPNTILTDTATYHAASGAIEFEDFGKHRLKGFSDLIQAWRPIRARVLSSRFAKRATWTRLVGRDLELRQLLRSWEEVSTTRQGKAIVIAGEAGIGKSRLLNEFQQRLANSNQMMLQCFPAFEHSTLYPFLTALKNNAGIEDNDNTEDKLQKLRSELRANDIPISTALSILSNLLSISATGTEVVVDISSERYRNITKQLFG
jgi:class 3 adenylate cyclase